MTVEHRLLTMRLTVLVDKVKYKVSFFLGGKPLTPMYLLRRIV